MSNWRSMGLLARVNLIVVVVLLIFFAAGAWFGYQLQQDYVLNEAVEKARLVAQEAIRTREYLSQQLVTGQVELNLERYGLIPVVASQRIGRRIADDLGYVIRQTSLRTRNPVNSPDAFERQALERFIAEPELKEIYQVRDQDGPAVFRYLKPFVADQSCLRCHGDPKQAPEFIRKLFPADKDQAYNYRIGEVIGAASVSIPMDRLSEQVSANLRLDLLRLGGLFLVLATFLGLLIKLSVLKPLGLLGQAIRRTVETGRFANRIPFTGQGEVAQLINGFNSMMAELKNNADRIEESERRFRLLTDLVHDAVVAFIPDGKIILFNRQAERLFGYGRGEMLGENLSLLIHQDCGTLPAEGLEEWLNQRDEQGAGEEIDLVGRRRDGTPMPLCATLARVKEDGYRFYTLLIRTEGQE
ncbi:MAG: hypothetical protein Tsb0017_17410 [Geothermobacteraceae bacterium]